MPTLPEHLRSTLAFSEVCLSFEEFVLCRSSFFPFSSGHCIVYPSAIYSFWLPLRYLLTFRKKMIEDSDFLDRAQLMTQKLPKQGYVAHHYKKVYGRHHNLVGRYEICISQLKIDLLLFLLRLPMPEGEEP